LVTDGILLRHYQGRSGGRDGALIDIAQDHVLKVLYDKQIFELGAVLKGGTALRKFDAGNEGRFSTDLDFVVPEVDLAELLFGTLEGSELGGFRFAVTVEPQTRMHGELRIENPALGKPPRIPASIDITKKTLILPPRARAMKPLPAHGSYGFELPSIPTVATEELIAEKLARFFRQPLVRDLYDLQWCAMNIRFDPALVRRLTVVKVWQDVVLERLGGGQFDPRVIVMERQVGAFPEEAIGYLTRPIDRSAWIDTVRSRYAFMTDLNEEERRISRCSLGERYLVETEIKRLSEGRL
jgi:predicted nucleotidyltransferase component of viral defense system